MINQLETSLCHKFNNNVIINKNICKKMYTKRVIELKKENIIFVKSMKIF